MSRRSSKHAERHQRFERWMTYLADALAQSGISARLGYDDRQLGDWMYLAIPAGPGLVEVGNYAELIVARGQHGNALVYFFAESLQATRAVYEALRDAHRRVPRTRNAKRKFVHLVERLVERLSETFDSRKATYPREVLERLPEMLPETRPMMGIGGHLHVKDGPRLEQHQHAASVAIPRPATGTAWDQLAASAPVDRRALRFDPDRQAFEAHGQILAILQDLLSGLPAGAAPLLVPGVAAAVLLHEKEEEEEHDSSDSVAEAVSGWDCAPCDVLSWGGDGGDLGTCDTPDCDVCTLPDCNLDCGGCDVPSPDCGACSL